MQYLRVLMKFASHAVTAVFAHNRKALLLGVLLDGVPDVAQRTARAHLLDAQPHAFVRDFGKTPGKYRWLTDVVHAAGVAKPAILDDRNVDIHDVAVFQDFLAGNAMADHMIDRRADGCGKRRIPRRRITDGGGLDLELIGDEFKAKPVELACGDSRFYMRRQEVQGGGCSLASGAHFIEIGGVGNETTHGNLNLVG